MENKIIPMRLLSYTRASKDQGCERAGYWSREWGGTGLVPNHVSWDLVYGNIIHKWLDKLAQNGSLDYKAVRDNVYTEALKAFGDIAHAKDWAAQAEGHMRAFCTSVWPLWMAEYEVLEPEAWVEYELAPGYKFRARRDLLLISKVDGHISYREYKSTSTTKPEFFASFDKDVQLHSGMMLEKYAKGREIRDGVVQTFYKGYKDKKLKTQRHAFAHGYINREYSMLPEYSYETKRAKGWELFSTYDEFPDLSVWISGMSNKHPQILSEQLGRTGPIFPRPDVVEKYFKQRLMRAQEINEGVELLHKAMTLEDVNDILDKYFPQNFEKCQPKYGGFNCEFLSCCWTPWIGGDPLGSGQFERYDPDRDVMVEVEA
jgi:translation initiation factor 2 beta subunit (eIF-2beta)/eIF-5